MLAQAIKKSCPTQNESEDSLIVAESFEKEKRLAIEAQDV